jgi:hypothetical protein
MQAKACVFIDLQYGEFGSHNIFKIQSTIRKVGLMVTL